MTALLQQVAVAWLAVINLITWGRFQADKRRARGGRSRERVAERDLLLLALLGGTPAAWAAIHLMRHKSAKPGFKTPLAMVTIVQLIMLLLVWWGLAG